MQGVGRPGLAMPPLADATLWQVASFAQDAGEGEARPVDSCAGSPLSGSLETTIGTGYPTNKGTLHSTYIGSPKNNRTTPGVGDGTLKAGRNPGGHPFTLRNQRL